MAEQEWAVGCARSLVTCYLSEGEDLNVHGAIREVLDGADINQVHDVLFLFVRAVGDVFGSLEDFSRGILELLAEKGP